MNTDGIKWEYIFNPTMAIENIGFVLSGIGYTLLISGVSFMIGMILGFFLALMRLSKNRVLNAIARVYISFMRGTPTLVLLFLLYFGLPFIGVLWMLYLPQSSASASVLPLIVAEIVRSHFCGNR